MYRSGIMHSAITALASAWLILPATSAQYTQQGPKLVGTGAAGLSVDQGRSVALSADGNTAAVGGPEDSNGTGAVWIFTRSAGVWTQQGPKLLGTGAVGAAAQGTSVALSADGNTLLAGGPADDESGINHVVIGAAWVFTRSAGVWTQQGSKLVGTGISTSGGSAKQGTSVALSGDGNTALVGGPADGSNYGASWVFVRNSGVWSQQSKLVGGGEVGSAGASQGYAVALSSDGNTALVGGPFDNPAGGALAIGAVWVFTRSGGVWTHQGPKLVGSGGNGQGSSVALSADGNTAIESSPTDNTFAGAAWVWTRSGGVWTQQGPKLVGAGVSSPGADQGTGVALSADGNTALLGGPGDDSVNATGAVWVFTRSGGVWSQSGSKLFGSGGSDPNQGASVAMSSDASTLLWGGPVDNLNPDGSGHGLGAAWVFVAGAQIVAPGSLPFGHLSAGGSETLPAAITNNGPSAVTLTSVNISGPNSGDFTAALNTCASPVNAGSSCTLDVTFHASTTTNESALLTLSWSPGVMTQTALMAGPPFAPPMDPTPGDGATGQATNLAAQWYFPPVAPQYQVYLGTSASNLPLYETGTSPQAQFNNLNPGTRYFWRVIATVGTQTATGTVWSFTTAGMQSQAPDAVWPLNGVTVDATTLTLEWTSVSGATQYKVFFGSNVDNLPLYTTVNAPTVKAAVFNLNPGTTYYWQVEAIVGGNTATSTKFAFTTPGSQTFSPPTLVWPPNGSTGNATSLNVEWTAVTGATQYKVSFGTSPTNLAPYTTIAAPEVKAAFFNLKSNTTYYWQVTAVNGSGNTATGPVWSFATQ